MPAGTSISAGIIVGDDHGNNYDGLGSQKLGSIRLIKGRNGHGLQRSLLVSDSPIFYKITSYLDYS